MIQIESSNVSYSDEYIEADYEYFDTKCVKEDGKIKVTQLKMNLTFRTERKVPRTGLMLIGWGGNNGTTVTGAVVANSKKMFFKTKTGVTMANYYGSLTQSSSVKIGTSSSGDHIYSLISSLLPMVSPNDLYLDGWDLSNSNLADAMEEAKVFDISLQEKLKPFLEKYNPRPAIYDAKFFTLNQQSKLNNIIPTNYKWDQVEQIRNDINDFKEKNTLDTVIVFWTANTEGLVNLIDGIHDSSEALLNAVRRNEAELSPSMLYAIAAILEGCTYINASPQNTFVPGLIKLAKEKEVFICGDDIKSGPTRLKTVLLDFLVSAGIKPCSIISYNHLGNNDGRNLSSADQLRSREISKSSLVDDLVDFNPTLYSQGLSRPDHCVVLKYLPYVGDSKRAMDEYVSELMLGGTSTIIVHNACEDSLLAAPVILDLVILAELFNRVTFRVNREKDLPIESKFQKFNSVLSILSYFLKAPLIEKDAKANHAFFTQRAAIKNILRALLGLQPNNYLDLHNKSSDRFAWGSDYVSPGSLDNLSNFSEY